MFYDLHEAGTVKTDKGTGVLLNQPTDRLAEPLRTRTEHGDMYLEFDFMLPPGSSATVHLQGRYGIRLNDSRSQAGAASGAILLPGRNNLRQTVPPRMNVGKAPGLWQNLKVSFQAPQFDSTGQKVAPATFNQVVYNGVVIHENIKVPGVTVGADKEHAMGPLVFSGDNPVAFQNIRYKMYGDERLTINNLTYNYYDGHNELPEVRENPDQSGPASEITWKLAGNQASFALEFTGELVAPNAGTYRFQIPSRGVSQLIIDNDTVVAMGDAAGAQVLAEGSHTFSLLHLKENIWITPELGFFVEGPGIAQYALHSPSSLSPPSTRPIVIEPEQRAVVQRCFLADEDQKKTFCAAVGDPKNIHYALDLSQGALVSVWKGGFLDATSMWTGRGQGQLAYPLGGTIELSSEPVVAVLQNKEEPWPDTAQNYQLEGYELDKDGRPTFQYSFQGTAVEDKITPADDGQYLTRTLRVNGMDTKNRWFRLAQGKKIERLPNGLYGIDDKNYYIRVASDMKQKPLIRQGKDGEELLIPASSLKDQQLAYSIIW